MNATEFKEFFKGKTHTTEEQQEIAGDNWEVYKNIYEHYLSIKHDLENVGEAYSKLVQRIPGVHSVRWRCKDPIGLIDKIIRKKSDDDQRARKKYENICVDDYQDLVTDLVGVRALYLFKEDFEGVHNSLMKKLRLKEKRPTYYHRKGDLGASEAEVLKGWGLLPKEHPVGYRSIHYVAQGGIDASKSAIIEIQVRSLFDEAWSEIDHKIRYPVFDDNPLIENLLQILNKLVGGADELSNYIKRLSGRVKEYEEGLRDMNEQNAGLTRHIAQLEKQAKSKISEGRQINPAEFVLDLESLKLEVEKFNVTSYKQSLLSAFKEGVERDKLLSSFDLARKEEERRQMFESISSFGKPKN
jgi:putative GTP pyrophosphokinase